MRMIRYRWPTGADLYPPDAVRAYGNVAFGTFVLVRNDCAVLRTSVSVKRATDPKGVRRKT